MGNRSEREKTRYLIPQVGMGPWGGEEGLGWRVHIQERAKTAEQDLIHYIARLIYFKRTHIETNRVSNSAMWQSWPSLPVLELKPKYGSFLEVLFQ